MSSVGLPAHVPGDAVSVCPCCGVPVIVGNAVFTGAAVELLTVMVAWVVAVVPSLAVAVMVRVWVPFVRVVVSRVLPSPL